ncbi:MAG: ABC transporter ATP-binding protein [Candidatus Kerfeldbacteria bacterium]|nr:ABC transporter ATP-binding protein [Candidatus Kerfeldbacteria bacterium]
MSLAKLQVSNISKTFTTKKNRTEVLQNISFTVGSREVVCLIGPSGCGKSTLFNVISGLDQPSIGTVEHTGRLAMMFQDPALLPWLTVEKNVGFGMNRQQYSSQAINQAVQRYLKIVALEQFGQAYPHELSGGMKQRAALARTLIIEPNIILMDEPFSALDAQTRERLQQFVQTLLHDYPVSIVFVTHDVREAVVLGDRVLVLTKRPAHIRNEYIIDLPRPRRSFDPNLDSYVRSITEQLQAETLLYS